VIWKGRAEEDLTVAWMGNETKKDFVPAVSVYMDYVTFSCCLMRVVE
jgi:hypothetical protein